MTHSLFLQEVLTRHQDGCVVDRCEDQGCELVLDGFDPDLLAIVGGTNYQSKHRFTERLCDFIVFGDDGQRFVCAVELKGGGNFRPNQAFDQMQNGLNVADDNAGKHTIDSWFPLLLYGGQIRPWRKFRFFLANQVEFRGERKTIQAEPCGSVLKPILRPD